VSEFSDQSTGYFLRKQLECITPKLAKLVYPELKKEADDGKI
jgi:hypothetical protein